MPTRMTTRFSISELLDATLHPSFSFTKGVPVLRLPPKTDEDGLLAELLNTYLAGICDSEAGVVPMDSQVTDAEPITTEDLLTWLQSNAAATIVSWALHGLHRFEAYAGHGARLLRA